MSKSIGLHSAWDDPNVKAALKEGRTPDDIAVLLCPRCWNYSYYNEGSHFSCAWCDYSASGDELDDLNYDDGMMSLADLDDGGGDFGGP